MNPMRRLLLLVAPEKRDIGIVVAFAIGVGLLTLSTPIAVQALVNFVAFGGLVQPLVVLGLLLFAFLTLAGIMRAFSAYVVEILQRRLFVRVVSDLGTRLPQVRIDAFDRSHGPELVNRFFDVLTVQKVGATLLLDGVGVVLQTAIGLLILAFYHPFLLAFDVVLIVGIGTVLFALGRGAVKTAVKESKQKYAVAALLEDIARNPVMFKLDGGPAYANRRVDALAVEYVQARRRHFRVVFRQIVGALALQALAATALLTLGGWLVMQGQLTLGQLVAAELIVSIVLASFAKFGKQLESFYDLLAAVDKLGQLIDLPLERASGEHRTSSTSAAAVDLIDVCYAYATDVEVLSNFSLHVEPGERVQIVGSHGSGKSTLTDLLFALRWPTAGRIELDGIDVRELSLQTIRKKIAIVKGIEVIEGTIAENVHMDRPHVNDTAVREALSAVGLLHETRSLPGGIHTTIATTAAPLSDGQAKRLMLARAIAGKPSILVLDGLLDDLDDESTKRLESVLLSQQVACTTIVLSRRVWDSACVDRLIPLDDMEDAATSAILLASDSGGR